MRKVIFSVFVLVLLISFGSAYYDDIADENTNEYYDLLWVLNVADKVYLANEYQLHKYDCTDFSKDLRKELRKGGISSRCIYGKLKNGSYPYHTWVEVNDKIFKKTFYIEATGGYIIDDKDLKENYRILSRGQCK